MESGIQINTGKEKYLEDPLITVIIPVYNVEAYLPQCLDSVIAQDYSNLDILLIDDGSTDRSGTICDQYAESDKRVRVIHHDNQGLSMTRNTGLDYVRGGFFCFIDSDDWVEPTLMSYLLEKHKETGATISTCKYFFETKKESENKLPEKQEEVRQYSGVEELGSAYYQDRLLGTASWGKLFKQGSLDGFRFPADRCYEDWQLISWIILKGTKVVCSSKKMYHYRQRQSSIVNSKTTQKKALDNWIARKDRYDTMGKLLPGYTEQMVYDCNMGIIQCLLSFKEMDEIYRNYLFEMSDFIDQNEKYIEIGKYTNKEKRLLRIARYRMPLLWKSISRLHDWYEVALMRNRRQMHILYP